MLIQLMLKKYSEGLDNANVEQGGIDPGFKAAMEMAFITGAVCVAKNVLNSMEDLEADNCVMFLNMLRNECDGLAAAIDTRAAMDKMMKEPT